MGSDLLLGASSIFDASALALAAATPMVDIAQPPKPMPVLR